MGLELNVAFVPNFNIYMIQYYLCHIICVVFYLLTLTSYSCCQNISRCKGYFPMQKGYFPMQRLFSDAEVGEDIAEDFVCGDFSTCYLCEMGETLAEVFRYEVARDADGHCFYYCSDVSE